MATQSTSTAPPTSDPSVVARLASKRDKWKAEAGKLATAKDAAEKRARELEQKLQDLEKGDAPARVKELEAQLRTLKHRATFDRLARERGAAPDVLDDLFALSGYKAEGDEPDEAAIGKLLDDAAAHPARSRFFAEWDGDEGEGEEGGGEPPARRPAPDAGRGARNRGEGTVYLTRDQLADPAFMLDPRNADLKARARVKP